MTIVDDTTRPLTDADVRDAVATWLRDLDEALATGSHQHLEDLFIEQATWRDFGAFSWDVSNRIGRDGLVKRLLDFSADAHPRDFAINAEQAPMPAGDGAIMAFFDFATDHRVNRAYVYLVDAGERWKAATLQTQAESLSEFPEAAGPRRKQGKVHGVVMDRTRWTSDRQEEAAFENTEPSVVVLGGGHNGLSIAARLGALGVPTLVIEREARIGDTWRKRYASLALHSIMNVDHLPYLPFPPTWTAHTPKDKWADFLESYATLLDLNVWTGTTFVDSEYDEGAERWTIRVTRADGSTRELHPRHFVVAAGLNGNPKIPAVEGLQDFGGVAVHSGEYQGGADWPGKKALVVGAGVSAHEIAHDLYEHGAEVTMLQRSATYVINFETFNKYWYGVYLDGSPFPTEFADQIAYSMPNRATGDFNRGAVLQAAEDDKELLDGLQAQGFKLEWGPENTGIIGSHMMGRDSYQINIGASELVASGDIRLKQGVELVRLTESTAVFSDGSELDVDLVMFATGYEPLWETIRPALGSGGSKIVKVYGQADDGEYANTWRRSAQPGLWFGTGFVGMARFHSKFMTLLIKAIEEGIVPLDDSRD